MKHSVCLLTLTLSAASAGAAEPPNAPADVRALGRDGDVALAWSSVPGAASYTVSHALTRAGPYTVIIREKSRMYS